MCTAFWLYVGPQVQHDAERVDCISALSLKELHHDVAESAARLTAGAPAPAQVGLPEMCNLCAIIQTAQWRELKLEQCYSLVGANANERVVEFLAAVVAAKIFGKL